MTTLPKSLIRGRVNSLDQERENFEKLQAMSIGKAINTQETSVKEKHVRNILIGTFQENGPITFWEYAMRLPVQEDAILAWKFCYVVHKLLREGHEKSISISFRYMNKFADLGRLWALLDEGYGKLIEHYCRLILQKLKFHAKYQGIPGNLQMSDEQLHRIGEADVSIFFQLACDIFDYMEEILVLQAAVFGSLDMARSNSLTPTGQCRLAPLISCIQDSSQLYDFSVKILFKLHASLSADTLQGHRDRFQQQFKQLAGFYANCSIMQYFKALVQVPHLPPSPPNFLVASDLNSHVSPVVVLPSQSAVTRNDLLDASSPSHHQNGTAVTTDLISVDIEEPVHHQQLQIQHYSQSPQRDELSAQKDEIIERLLKELEDVKLELDRVRIEDSSIIDELRRQRAEIEHTLEMQQNSVRQMQMQLASSLENKQMTCELQEEMEKKYRASEERFIKMKDVYTKLREEHIGLLRTKGEVEKQLHILQTQKTKINLANLIGASEAVIDSAVSELDIPLDQDRFLQNSEIVETSIKSIENNQDDESLVSSAFTLSHNVFQLLQSAKSSAHHCPSVEGAHDIVTMAKRQGQLTMQLLRGIREGKLNTTECLAALNEFTNMVESQRAKNIKDPAEDIGQLLQGELTQMDRAIEEATARIQQILSKSRTTDKGVKLEVNSKILDACKSLMAAIKELVKASRSLQEEIGGFSKEFYTKNHRWTEGLISAAKVVGIGANLLVDAADKCVSGTGRMEELIVASQEISAATAQLLVASKVKADPKSSRLATLSTCSRRVTEATAQVIATVKSCREQIEDTQDDLDGMTLHEAKRFEMELQVKVIELETDLEKERRKLLAFRRKHYHLEQ